MKTQTQRRKAVKKRAKAAGKVARIEASSWSSRHPRYLPEDWAGMYKPVKKPVTMRVDADVLAWFQRGGRGYQTRINRALRKVMMEERKKARE
jgi:uncharacterized protein (DUF4415 family)